MMMMMTMTMMTMIMLMMTMIMLMMTTMLEQSHRCKELSWVDWEVENLKKGFMYCCDLQEAASAFPEIDSLEIKTSGLLKTS